MTTARGVRRARRLLAVVAVQVGLGITSTAAAAPVPALAPAPARVSACPPSSVEELIGWRRSDVVTARLANGVVLHHRLMAEAGIVVLAATFAPGFDDDAVASRAAAAVETQLRADPRAEGLRIDVVPVETGLVSIVRGSEDRLSDMASVVAAIVDQPVEFDPGVPQGRTSARWVARRAVDAVLDGRPVTPARGGADDPPARVRWPASGKHDWIEVAIAGTAPLASALAVADGQFAALPARAAPKPPAAAPAPAPDAPGERTVIIHSDDVGVQPGRESVSVALLARNGTTLAGQRVVGLAASVLRRRLASTGDAGVGMGVGAGAGVGVQFVPRGVVPGAGLIIVSGQGEDGAGEGIADGFVTGLRGLTTPASPEEFAAARDAYAEVPRQFMTDPAYWASVLSSSVARGFTPDELAAAESDIAAITPDAVAQVIARAFEQSSPVTVIIKRPARSGRTPAPTDQP